jgi:glycosyltransferase involved in cell wall biosynthesis
MKILFVYPSLASFVARDLKILREKHEVTARQIRHKNPWRFFSDVRALLNSDAVFLWFASIYALPLATLAKIFRKRVVTVVGGYEVANEPEIEYGSARSVILTRLVRWILNMSDVVIAISRSSEEEIRRHHPSIFGKTKMIYHGFEDMFGALPKSRESLVVNVGAISDVTWLRKGIYDFILTSERMPDVKFVQFGKVQTDVAATFGHALPANLVITGEVSFEQLRETLSSAKVYLQLSRHEGFGCSVAEAMLGGCIPVVSNAAALPEVVGDCGIVIGSREIADAVAEVHRALAMPDSEGERARQRVLENFSYNKRRDALLMVMDLVAKK